MKQKDFSLIHTDEAPAAVGAYSQGLEVDGTYYFSGQIGIDPATMELKRSFAGQLEQVLKNIDALLKASGLTRSNIIKSTVFLTDINNFPVVNDAYKTFFTEPFPVRSCIEASKLPKGALVEIEVTAHN